MKYILYIICLFLSFSSQADELSSLYSKLNTIFLDPSLLAEAIDKGEERALVCKYCHGSDGNSKRNYIPNLAEQNTKYLLNQFELFASKQRKNRIMSELAKNLSDDDRVNISLFYSTQKVKPVPSLQPELLSKGKKIFQSQCSSCHGNDGYGKEALPRIAGQPTEFLKITLDRYRIEPDKRSSSPMQAIAGVLSKSDQSAVIAFVSAMR